MRPALKYRLYREHLKINGLIIYISGDAAYAVLEAESFEVNGEAASVIFDASTTIVNGEVFRISEERATVIIYGE